MKKHIAILFLSISTLLFSQSEVNHIELGSPFITNFEPKEYGSHFQNWDILQDDAGLIYVANGDAVLQYDGTSWRKLELPNFNRVIRLVKDDQNKIYIGADSELGYIDFDSRGFMKYVSLIEKIPKEHQDIKSIWNIFILNDLVIFRSDHKLYFWDGERMEVLVSDYKLRIGYQVGEDFYFWVQEVGLIKLIGKKFELIPGGDLFKEAVVFSVLPYDNSSVLVVTRTKGIFLYDGNRFEPFANEVQDYLNKSSVLRGLLIKDLYAFATLSGGLILMNHKGEKVRVITTQDGLPSDQLYSLTSDNQSGLWLGSNSGISRVEINRPYSIFSETKGLKGLVTSIKRYKGQIYVGTNTGFYVLNKDSSGQYIFNIVKGGEKMWVWDMVVANDELVIGTEDGVFVLSDGDIKQVNKITLTILYKSRIDPNRIYIGHPYGLSAIYRNNDNWVDEGNSLTIKEQVISIEETNSGDLWLGTESEGGVLNLKLGENGKWDQNTAPKVFKEEKGVQPGWNRVFIINDVLWVRSDCGFNKECLHYFDKTQKKFIPDSSFAKSFEIGKAIYPYRYQHPEGHLLLRQQVDEQFLFSAFNKGNEDYLISKIEMGGFGQMITRCAYWEEEKILWMGGEALIRYDLTNNFKTDPKFSTYVRKVTVSNDSVIFAGMQGNLISEISAEQNVLRIEYAATFFDASKKNQYQYKLEGFDKEWSAWSDETRKDYTNLPGKDYEFKVRAKNIYGVIGEEGNYYFTVLPPWYLSIYAYILYVTMAIILVWLLVKWRSQQLLREKEILENLVIERTKKISKQSELLKQQAYDLQELDRAKSRFFANISHEFRTPLTLIKGPIERLEQDPHNSLSMDNIKMIRRNTNRVLNLVNQLLDLSKIDEGNLKLEPTEGDIYKCLRTATSSFNSHAAQRNIDYKVLIPRTVLWASFDRDKLEKVTYNLLSNAFKFSDDDSQISFETEYDTRGLQIQVADSGKGIPQDKLPFIFDRFYQVDSDTTKEKEGSGIGLSLSKNLVELMGGTITASSELNQGSCFSVYLPIQEIKTRGKKLPELELQLKKSVFKPKTFIFNKTDQRNVPVILLVEDNNDMRHFIKEQLINLYKIREAFNGDVGLQNALANPPDLIITDLMMPKMDGIELCRMLKTDVNTSHIPIIMLTAKAGTENKIEGLETGADDYLVKPFDVNELLVRVKNLIEQREKLRKLYVNKEVIIDPKKITVTSVDQKFLEQVLTLLENKFSDSDFGVPLMQETLGMSKTQLHRKLKALTNEAPGELLRNFRLKRAAQLILQKADSVTQIAYQVGFNNLSYFAKCFKDLYGVSPSSYPASTK